MADVVPVRTDNPDGTHRHRWGTLTSTDTQGEAVSIPGAADRTVQINGADFDGATVIIEGSVEETPTNFHTLTDPQGNAISKSSASLEAILENVTWVRPRLTGAGASTDIDVTILSRK